MIYDDIGGGIFSDGITAKSFAKELKDLGNVEQLDVRINSMGGDVNDGLTIYRLLADHPARVNVRIDGVAASIASAVAMAGDEIVIAESGSIMIHEAWGALMGTAGELESYARMMRGFNDILTSLYADRTGNDRDTIAAWMKAGDGNFGTWFNGQSAVDAGFASRVVENVKLAASGKGVEEYQQEFMRLLAARPRIEFDVPKGGGYDLLAAAERRALSMRLRAMKLRFRSRPLAA